MNKETGMPRIEVDGSVLELTEDGFLAHPEVWSKECAAVLAHKQEGIQTLTAAHWVVINFIRKHFLEHGVAPLVRVLCKKTGFTLKRIYELFPSGPAKGACKIAGLPGGDSCV